MTSRPTDQAARLRARVAARRCRVVTVTSGKGGVGKTTLAANLGLELARSGRNVLLLDGDLGLANLSILFNLAPRWDLGDVFAGRCALGDAVVEVRPGLHLLPAAAGAAALADLSAESRGALLDEIHSLGAAADLLLIDTGAGLSPTVLSLVAMADRTLLVTTHEPTALSDAYGLVKAAVSRGVADIEVVINEAASHAQARDTHAKLCRLTQRFLAVSPPLVAVIPRDECVGEAIVRQEPLTTIYPYARATRAIAALARLFHTRPGGYDARTPISLAVPVRR
jgi:flagellar biosynthesis protein FlhG